MHVSCVLAFKPTSPLIISHAQEQCQKLVKADYSRVAKPAQYLMSLMFARRMMPTVAFRAHGRRQILSIDHFNFKRVTQLARFSSNTDKKPKASQNLVVAVYCAALATFILGVSYASVPLYKVFCSMTGLFTYMMQLRCE